MVYNLFTNISPSTPGNFLCSDSVSISIDVKNLRISRTQTTNEYETQKCCLCELSWRKLGESYRNLKLALSDLFLKWYFQIKNNT